jgi:hypothetical protein
MAQNSIFLTLPVNFCARDPLLASSTTWVPNLRGSRSMERLRALRYSANAPVRLLMVALIALLLAYPLTGQACPREGPDHRPLGHGGCPVQRKLTIEGARPPRTICIGSWLFFLR